MDSGGVRVVGDGSGSGVVVDVGGDDAPRVEVVWDSCGDAWDKVVVVERLATMGAAINAAVAGDGAGALDEGITDARGTDDATDGDAAVRSNAIER